MCITESVTAFSQLIKHGRHRSCFAGRFSDQCLPCLLFQQTGGLFQFKTGRHPGFQRETLQQFLAEGMKGGGAQCVRVKQ